MSDDNFYNGEIDYSLEYKLTVFRYEDRLGLGLPPSPGTVEFLENYNRPPGDDKRILVEYLREQKDHSQYLLSLYENHDDWCTRCLSRYFASKGDTKGLLLFHNVYGRVDELAAPSAISRGNLAAFEMLLRLGVQCDEWEISQWISRRPWEMKGVLIQYGLYSQSYEEMDKVEDANTDHGKAMYGVRWKPVLADIRARQN
jgi:hypothetical protein